MDVLLPVFDVLLSIRHAIRSPHTSVPHHLRELQLGDALAQLVRVSSS